MFNIIPTGWIYLYFLQIYKHEESMYNGLWKRGGIRERLSLYILNTFDLLKIFFMMNGVMFYNQPKQ